jgi:hypothetical protein
MEGAARVDKEVKESREKRGRRLRNFLIDSRYQLRWVFRVIVTISVIVSVLGYLLYRTVADATDQMLAQKMADIELTQSSIDAFIKQSHDDKTTTLWILVVTLFALVVILSLATIVITHKIAGPLYKMRRVFASISGDNLRLWDKLRRGDELKEVFDELADMLSRLREHRRRDTEDLEALSNAMADKEEYEEMKQRLQTVIERYKNSVKMT